MASGNKINIKKNIIWFTVLGFLRPSIQIFLLPLYLVKLSPSEYGILALIIIFSNLFGTLVGLKLNVAVNTFYFDYNHKQEILKDYIGQVFTFALLLAIISFCFIFLTGQIAFDLIFSSTLISFFPFGIIATAQVLLSTCNSIYFTYLKNSYKVKEFVLLNSLVIVIQILIQAILILVFNYGILGILIGNLIPVFSLFLFLIFRHRFLLNFKLDFAALRPSLFFGLGFLPIGFLSVFEKQIDKFILERYMSLEHVGLYALLISIVGLFNVLIRAFDNAIKPVLYQSLKNNDDKTKYTLNSIYRTYTNIGIFSLAGIMLIGSNLHLITSNPKYLSIVVYFPVAILAVIPMILVKYEILVILFYKKTFLLSIITIIKTLFMIFIMIILIPKYGIYGAILSLSISNILNLISFKILNSKLSNLHFEHMQLLYRILPFVILIFLHCFFGESIGYSLSSILVFCLTVIFIGFMERTKLKSILKPFL